MIEVELQGGGKITLKDLAGAKAWLEAEREEFRWLTGDTGHHNAQEMRKAHKSGWLDLENSISSGDEVAFAETAKRLFEGEKSLYLCDSPEGRFLCGLARFNPKVANAAASLLHGFETPAVTVDIPSYQCASASIAAFLMSTQAAESDLLRTKNLAAGIARSQASELDRTREQYSKNEVSFNAIFEEFVEKGARGIESQNAEFKEMLSQARNEYDEQKRFFLTELAHLAPVEYWRTVKKSAKKVAIAWGIVFAVLILGLAVALGLRATALRTFLAQSEHESVAVILAIAISTLAFWALRMTARIFLSSYHRSTDAAERETMVMTFLALRREGHISENLLSLVLAPLFRPGATGLVKADAAPEFSAASLLTRERR